MNLNKSLNELEGKIFSERPEFGSYVVQKTYELLDKKLKDYTPADLRLMIGQNFGLKYLIPMAIELLKKNPLIEATFYEGDLLTTILNVDKTFWKENPEYINDIQQIFSGSIDIKSLENNPQYRQLYRSYLNFFDQNLQ